MIIPIRCFTCNKVIANKWGEYLELLKRGIPAEEAMNMLGMRRYCCRRIFLTHIDIIDKLLMYT